MIELQQAQLCALSDLGRRRACFAGLILALLAAWIGILREYLPVADDFPFARAYREGLWGHIWAAYSVTGIRRSFAFAANMPLCASPVELTSFLCLALHCAATALVFDVARMLANSSSIALGAAVLFGVFPFGYGAVTWACGTYIIVCLSFYLAGLWTLLSHARSGRTPNWLVAGAAATLIFLGCVVGEHLVFASALIGALAVATQRRVQLSDWKNPLVLAPVIAVALYLSLVLITQSGAGIKGAQGQEHSLASFNPGTLLSVWFYQYRHLDMFQPWLSLDAVRISLHDLGWPRIVIGSLLLVGSARWMLRATIAEARADIETEAANHASRWQLLLILLGMMLGVSAVHAVVGGYSASSRHQYVPLALLSLLLATGAGRFTRWSPSVVIGVVVGLLPLAVTTTWLVTCANRFELQRHHALAAYLANRRVSGAVRIEYEPEIYFLWPKMSRTISHPFEAEWVLNLALQDRSVHPVVLKPAVPWIRAVWTGECFRIDSDLTLFDKVPAPSTAGH